MYFENDYAAFMSDCATSEAAKQSLGTAAELFAMASEALLATMPPGEMNPLWLNNMARMAAALGVECERRAQKKLMEEVPCDVHLERLHNHQPTGDHDENHED